jgi:spore photoproduct lyase
MDTEQLTSKRGTFGAVKHVYPKDVMGELRGWFTDRLAAQLPQCGVRYWT